MPIATSSLHTAELTVPVSGDPADKIEINESPDQRLVTFRVQSTVSEADAKSKIRGFLQAARDASQA